MKKKAPNKQKDVIVYQTKSGAIELALDAKQETFLLTQQQVARVFDVKKAAISKHVKNIFDSGELDKRATVSILETVQTEGKRDVVRKVEHYNLDLVISIGYRVNSLRATKFRQWATKTLRQHIVDGYTINRSRIAKNYDAFIKAVEQVRSLLPAQNTVDAASILELVSIFADTWVSLDAYDKEIFSTKKITKRKVKLTAEKLTAGIAVLKSELLKKGEATELFAAPRERGAIEGIVGNVVQSFGGQEMYPSVEEKAAHLLYFMVKDHPFVDGNKRSGAYAFVWFLRLAKALDTSRITPAALTALTLLVAESDPKDKDRVVGLITMLLGRPK